MAVRLHSSRAVYDAFKIVAGNVGLKTYLIKVLVIVIL